MKRIFCLLFCGFALMVSSAAPAQVSVQDSRLSKIHSQLISDHPNLTHISAAEIDALIGDNDNILLLDVREDKEDDLLPCGLRAKAGHKIRRAYIGVNTQRAINMADGKFLVLAYVQQQDIVIITDKRVNLGRANMG